MVFIKGVVSKTMWCLKLQTGIDKERKKIDLLITDFYIFSTKHLTQESKSSFKALIIEEEKRK